ncbi:MAG TPA: polysaccharide export protein EpsE [Methylibium sp.]|nr:polysaccharide export protein EpsE [Methylibium sp.]
MNQIVSIARRLLTGALVAASGAVLAQTPPATPPAAATRATAPEYRLAPGDQVRITVFQNPDLSVETRITEAGSITFPLIGTVNLRGLTTSQAERRIADALRDGNYVKQPQVSVQVSQVRGNQVSVLGQVGRPGRYPIETGELRLTDLLATAGGISPTGADIVTVVGTRNGKPYRVEVDLPRVFGPDRRSEDVLLQNEDVVWVDRAPSIYIYGEVQRPGAHRLERGLTVLQTLATAGGLTARGTEKGIRLHRRSSDGKVQIIQPGMDDPMRDGDVLYVRESLF